MKHHSDMLPTLKSYISIMLLSISQELTHKIKALSAHVSLQCPAPAKCTFRLFAYHHTCFNVTIQNWMHDFSPWTPSIVGPINAGSCSIVRTTFLDLLVKYCCLLQWMSPLMDSLSTIAGLIKRKWGKFGSGKLASGNLVILHDQMCFFSLNANPM